MNKRIQELAEQATVLDYSTWDSYNQKTIDHYKFDKEKFAELIVKECLDVMSKTSEEANARFTYMGDDVPTVVHQMKIEKHFGVEE